MTHQQHLAELIALPLPSPSNSFFSWLEGYHTHLFAISPSQLKTSSSCSESPFTPLFLSHLTSNPLANLPSSTLKLYLETDHFSSPLLLPPCPNLFLTPVARLILSKCKSDHCALPLKALQWLLVSLRKKKINKILIFLKWPISPA